MNNLYLSLSIALLALLAIGASGDSSSTGGQDKSNGQQQQQHPNHQPGAVYHPGAGIPHSLPHESIDVSSSIGVSMPTGGGDHKNHHQQKHDLGHVGMVEDLLANESAEGDGPKMAIAPPNGATGPGPASLSHASVVDSDTDLIGAETEPKFSLSKLKRPFHLPDSLRFNNRFLNGAANFLAAGSNLIHHRQPPHQGLPPQGQLNGQQQGGPQQGFSRQLPPQMRPNFRPPLGAGGNGGPQQFQQGPPPPQHQHQQQPQPIYKSLNIPPPQGPHPGQQQHQQQNQQFNQKPHMIPPYQQGPVQQGFSPSPQAGGPTFHVIEETIPMPQGSSGNLEHGDIMHSIADFISQEDNNVRQSEPSLNDYDNRQPLSSPSNDIWPLSQPDLAKIVHLDVKCEKNFMKVSVEFDRPYTGMIFSKGHFSSPNCIHLPAGSGRTHVYFDIRMDSCGTSGNVGANQMIPAGGTAAGNFFENTVIFQYDPFVQEAWDQARKLRCTWHDQYEKSVSFRPFPVDMVDVVRADFAGDNVGCWMQIQVGRGPWASEVAGIVKIGQTMTMVLAIKDEENKFDMLVRNCVAHDGKRPPIELVDTNGCIVRSKLMSRFTKIKNFGSSASVLSYAHFQAFKFPDSMEVHFQCTIQICKHSCPEQCDTSGSSNVHYVNHQISGTLNTGTGSIQNHQIQPLSEGLYIDGPGGGIPDGHRAGGDSVLARPREIRSVNAEDATELPELQSNSSEASSSIASKEVGVNKVIRVVSTGDLSFATSDKLTSQQQQADSNSSSTSNSSESSIQHQAKSWLSERINEKICMSSLNFIICFAILVILLLVSCTCSVVLCCRKRVSTDDCPKKKTAKESALTSKMVLGAQAHARNDYHQQHQHHSSHHSQNGSGLLVSSGHNGASYLSSSSVLSPRVQASGYGGATAAHHRSSDLYHS